MTDITLAGCEPRTLLSHMALYGLGAILEADGVRDVRLGVDGRPANPRPYVSAADDRWTSRIWRHDVRRHAQGSSTPRTPGYSGTSP